MFCPCQYLFIIRGPPCHFPKYISKILSWSHPRFHEPSVMNDIGMYSCLLIFVHNPIWGIPDDSIPTFVITVKHYIPGHIKVFDPSPTDNIQNILIRKTIYTGICHFKKLLYCCHFAQLANIEHQCPCLKIPKWILQSKRLTAIYAHIRFFSITLSGKIRITSRGNQMISYVGVI